MRKKFSASLDLATLVESSGKDDDGKNPVKENMILDQTKKIAKKSIH